MSPEKDDFYADILIYVTGCVLFILAVVIIVLCRMRMTTQKTLPTPPVQKLSKFPLKRQVTESRYKICKDVSPLPSLCLRLAVSEMKNISPTPLLLTFKLRFCSHNWLRTETWKQRWLLEFLEFLGNLFISPAYQLNISHRQAGSLSSSSYV